MRRLQQQFFTLGPPDWLKMKNADALRDHGLAFCAMMGGHDRSARALSLSRLIFQPVAAGAVDLGLKPSSIW
jgi:hypothetical protein